MTVGPSRRRSWLAFGLVLLVVTACQKQEAPKTAGPDLSCPPAASASGAPVDPPLLAFLSRARSAHRLADEHEKADPPAFEDAIKDLRAVIDGPRPAAPNERAEIREVMGDTYARLADLQSRLGRFDEALVSIETGLGLTPETTYYRGLLVEQRGHVEERRSLALEGTGDAAGAKAAKQRSLAAFSQAVDIQGKVIECSLREGEKP
jgi:tetratricopeptide (TPR) repeat protein